MKGKNYLIITSILIIAGSLAGFMTDIFSSMFPGNWHVSSLVSAVICLLFLITGIMGLACRKIYSLICVILGIILCIFSILSIPLMFWAGDGSFLKKKTLVISAPAFARRGLIVS